MKKFKEYIAEEKTPLQKAEEAILAGDHDTALTHLKNHVPGKSRIKDAHVSRLIQTIKSKQSK